MLECHYCTCNIAQLFIYFPAVLGRVVSFVTSYFLQSTDQLPAIKTTFNTSGLRSFGRTTLERFLNCNIKHLTSGRGMSKVIESQSSNFVLHTVADVTQ